MLNVIKWRKTTLTLSLLLVIASIVLFFIRGLNLDVDFTGGTTIYIDIGQQFSNDDISSLVKQSIGVDTSTVQKSGDNEQEVVIKVRSLSNEELTKLFDAIAEKYDLKKEVKETAAVDNVKAADATAAEDKVSDSENVSATEAPLDEEEVSDEENAEATEAPDSEELSQENEAEATEAPLEKDELSQDENVKTINTSLKDEALLQVDNVNATVGKELSRSAIIASLIAIVLMLLYISIRFEFFSALAAIYSLAQNVIILVGIYSLFQLPVNTTFIAAILTILGYSINDTIVIFDRIRENDRVMKKTAFSDVANVSVNQSVTRSINTSVTTLITIVVLFILGVSSIKQFALPIIIGVTIGTFSSLFIATPIWWMIRGDGKYESKSIQ